MKKGIIRMDELVTALENRVGLSQDNAQDVARRVLNYFGYGEIIIDNILDQDDRRLFYFLQDQGFLSTEWDETFLLNGRGWRIFYWRLKVDSIRRFSRLVEEEPEEKTIRVYESLPDQAWVREEGT